MEAIEQHRLPSNTNDLEQFIEHVDHLIRCVKDIEEEIRVNAIQPLSDYERLIGDCQRLINELDRNLRLPVEQTITNGKRFYSTDNRDSSGMESAGKNANERKKTRKRKEKKQNRTEVVSFTFHVQHLICSDEPIVFLCMHVYYVRVYVFRCCLDKGAQLN